MTGRGLFDRTIWMGAVMLKPGHTAALRSLCDSLPGVRLDIHHGSVAQALTALGLHGEPDLILIEIDPEDHGGTRKAVAMIAERFAEAAVLATCVDASIDLARQLMRMGVRDLIPHPIARDDLVSALSSLGRRGSGRAAKASRAVAFLKAGGGSGATTLAVQTAAQFAGRRTQAEPEVCMLDLDLQFGSAALSLDLDDRVGLGDLVEARSRLDGALLRSVMGHHASGVDVLAPPRSVLPLDALDSEFVIECLSLARAEYSTVILDLPTAWTAWSHAALRHCDLIVLVTRADIPGVRRARRQMEALRENGLGEVPLRLVMNRDTRGWGASARRREAEQALGRRFDYLVREDRYACGAALNRGVPIAKAARWSRLNRDLRILADGIAHRLAKGPLAQAARPMSGTPVAVGEVS